MVVARAGAGSWLDDEVPLNWNSPGATVPAAPAIEGRLDPRATARERSPEIPEDNALIASGWRLFTSYQAGWGLKVIEATTMYDGMGRPWGYQAFVFADGRLAGTLAPEPMFSRFDGALDRVFLSTDGAITATFRRYAETDPLCCPSGSAFVEYRIERTDLGAQLVPVLIRSAPIG